MSTNILGIESINSMNNDVLGFSKPMFNDIKIVSPETLLLFLKPPYYGDTVNIRFWSYLNISIGSTSDPIYHLTDGYKYIYNHTKRTFDVYDSSSINIGHIEDIKSIGDMKIDFKIYKSHQFEILIDVGDKGVVFYIPTIGRLNKLNFYNKFIYDTINNCFTGDANSDYYLNINFHNYDEYKKYYYEIYNKVYINDKHTVLNNYGYYDSIINNEFIKYYNECKQGNIKNRNITVDVLGISYTLAILSFSLFPMLQSIEREGETVNNRPLYEPWLIWGYYDFLFNKIIKDNSDDFELFLFDLSPSWA